MLTWHAWAARQSALRQSLETLLALKKVSMDSTLQPNNAVLTTPGGSACAAASHPTARQA